MEAQSQEIIQSIYQKDLRASPHTAKSHYNILTRFLDVIQISDLQQVTRVDFEQYVLYLEQQDLKLSTKHQYVQTLRSIFDEFEDIYMSRGMEFRNPIPKAKYVVFSHDQSLTLSEKEKKQLDRFFTIDQLLRLLQLIYNGSYQKWVMTLLLTFTGLRISEVLTIKRENVREGYLMTGTEAGARKSGEIYVMYPQQMSDVLFDYMAWLDKKFPKSEWLFPSTRAPHISLYSLEEFYRKIQTPFKVTSHKFRRTLMTYWHRNNVSLEEIEILSNHTPSNVSFKHYVQVTIEERKKMYDQAFPKEYRSILAWLESL